MRKAASRILKKGGNVFKGTGKDTQKEDADGTNKLVAEVWEHQIFNFNTNEWSARLLHGQYTYTFENEGMQNTFPLAQEYLNRLEPGFYFDEESKWYADDWIENKSISIVKPKAQEAGSSQKAAMKALSRRRKWKREMRYEQPGDNQDNAGFPLFHYKKFSGLPTSNDVANAQTRAILGLKEVGKKFGLALKKEGLGGTEAAGDENKHSTSEGDNLNIVGQGAGDCKDPSRSLESEARNASPVATRTTSTLQTTSTTALSAAKQPISPVNPSVSKTFFKKVSLKDTEDVKEPSPAVLPEQEFRQKVPAPAPTIQFDNSFYIKDPRIKELGKQIKELEKESVKAFEVEKEEWKKSMQPILKEQVQALEARSAELKKRLEEELTIGGVGHANVLEKEVEVHQEVLEDMKKNMYFPFSTNTFGTGGAYCAFDDIWLESMSGHIHLELQPGRSEKSSISLLLTGTGQGDSTIGDGYDQGLEMRFKIENFKSAGDKGKNIPKTTMSEVKVRLSVVVSINLFFDPETETWSCDNAEHFYIQLLKFRGPFGARRSMMNGVLNLMVPSIKNKVLQLLPKELGHLVATLPSPFEMAGTFSLKGVMLNTLTQPIADCELAKSLCHCSSLQLNMFLALQKAMDRWEELKTIEHILKYMRVHRKNTKLWRSLCVLWEQACQLYCEEMQLKKATEAADAGNTSFASGLLQMKFINIVGGIEEIRRKRVNIRLKIYHIEGQANLNKAARLVSQLLYRYNRMEKEEEIKQATSDKGKKLLFTKGLILLDRITTVFENTQTLIKQTCRNFDFAQMRITSTMRSGSDGYLRSEVSDLFAQFPMLIDTSIANDMTIVGTLVPFRFNLKPRSTGDVTVELAHMVPPGYDDDFPMSANGARNIGSDNENKADLDQNISTPAHKKSVDMFTPDNSSGMMSPRSAKNNNQVMPGLKTPPAVPPPLDIHGNVVSPVNQVETAQQSATELMNQMGAEGSPVAVQLQARDNNFTGVYPGSVKAHQAFLAVDDLRHAAATNVDYMKERERQKKFVDQLVLSISARKPHISIIVDQESTLKPGAELFTLMLGPRAQQKGTFGVPDMLDKATQDELIYGAKALPPLFPYMKHPVDLKKRAAEEEEEEEKVSQLEQHINRGPIVVQKECSSRLTVSTKNSASAEDGLSSGGLPVQQSNKFGTGMSSGNWEGFKLGEVGIDEEGWEQSIIKLIEAQKKEEDKQRKEAAQMKLLLANSSPDCPIFLQTAPGIKMLLQVPRVDLSLHITAFIRFVAAHFVDLLQLKEWLRDALGTEIMEENLAVGQIILEKLAKYLLLPGLNFELNLNARIVAQACEILLRFDTPKTSGFSPGPRPKPFFNMDGTDGHSLASDLLAMKINGDGDSVAYTVDSSSQLDDDGATNFGDHEDDNTTVTGEGEVEDGRKGPPCAVKFGIALNLMDLLEDGLSILRSMKDAKHAYAEYAAAKAQAAMHVREKNDTMATDESGFGHKSMSLTE